ncbi:ParB/RepB/Spo0J family partition protein [Streptomyces polyrhachis]|uniref:ParB/RepB/Spo0J family partition protein n=1 Tax=Streptomyces polyrhachis TaxID=1282885 RepID=A0ABW2GJZ4_9ACTN
MSEQSESTASLFGLGREGGGTSNRSSGLAGLLRGPAAAPGTPAAAGQQTAPPAEDGPRALDLPLNRLSENPDNPRETLGDVSELAASLTEVGQVQPLTVATVTAYLKPRPQRAGELTQGADFVVIDGHRRLAAAKEAKLEKLRVVVDDARVATDTTVLEAAYVANFHREDLTELEQATALETLVGFYGSQGKAAKRLGLSQGFISQKLSLLKLSSELQADLQSGRRTEEEVRNLGTKSPEEQRALADARRAKARQAGQAKREGRAAADSEEAVTHHGVMGPEAGEGSVGTAPAPTYPRLRWDDPHAVAKVIRSEMSDENIAILRKALDEQR